MKSYSGFIGLFWYIDDLKKLVTFKYSLDEEMRKSINQSAKHITAGAAHYMVWAVEFSEHTRPWNYYPRGRVNYNRIDNCFELDMDSCLHHRDIISEILSGFQADENSARIIKASQTNKMSKTGGREGHYRCYKCGGRDAFL